jgi:hypothetical protein
MWTVSAVAPFTIYGDVPLNVDTYLPDPIWQKLMQAGGGSVALLGIPASVLLLTWAWRSRRPLPAVWRQVKDDDVMALFGCAVALYGMRFVLLSDELEYVVILVPLLLLVVLRAGASVPAVTLLALALAFPNFVQLHLAERDPRGRLRPTVGLSPGAIVQDRRARERLEYLHTGLPDMMRTVARANGCSEYATMPTGDEGRCVIIPYDQLRFYIDARHGGRYFRVGCTQRIFTYPMPSHRGWRQLIRFADWRMLTRAEFQAAVLPYCTHEGPQR